MFDSFCWKKALFGTIYLNPDSLKKTQTALNQNWIPQEFRDKEANHLARRF
jgi:hypothetical protein